MENKGVLEEIRSLVREGQDSRDLISKGYAPGSVYKAQRQVRTGTAPEPVSGVPSGAYGGVLAVEAALQEANEKIEELRAQLKERDDEVRSLKLQHFLAREDVLWGKRREEWLKQDAERARSVAEAQRQEKGRLQSELFTLRFRLQQQVPVCFSCGQPRYAHRLIAGRWHCPLRRRPTLIRR